MARQYEGKIRVLTSPGLDSTDNMSEAVRDFKWPSSIVSMPDRDGKLWSHFGARFRGTWVLINSKGEVVQRTSPHPRDLQKHLDMLVSG